MAEQNEAHYTSTEGTDSGPLLMQDHDLVDVATRFIGGGISAVKPDLMVAARREVERRMAEAQAEGLSQREAVASILKPVFTPMGHCGCHACRERCPVCRFTGA